MITLATIVGLLVGIALAIRAGRTALAQAGGVLLLNALAGRLAQIATGHDAPLEWLLLFDVACAFIMLWPPSSSTKAAIGIVYIFQIALHAVHWGAGMGGADTIYLSMLNVGGGLQIAFLIYGAVNDGGRKVGRLGRNISDFGGVVPHGVAGIAGGRK